MVVRYARDRGYKGEGTDPHLSLGKEYIAHGIEFREGAYAPRIGLRSANDGHPFILEITFFDIIDPRVPDDWYFINHGNGYYDLQPQEFTGDFWAWYHDGTEEQGIYARQILNNVLIKIKRFHDRWDL